MTKQKMIAEIQAKEAALWLDLAAYDHEFAPVDGDRSNEIFWDCNDEGHLTRLHAWCAVHDLMESLGIEDEFDNDDRAEASELRSDLFRRRQAARGIFYN